MGLHVGGIGSAVRLGETEAADELPACHGGQVPVLLPRGAEGPDRAHAPGRLHGDEAPGAGTPALQPLAAEAGADRVQSRVALTGERGATAPRPRQVRGALL